jgi:hypothetical protein
MDFLTQISLRLRAIPWGVMTKMIFRGAPSGFCKIYRKQQTGGYE